MEEYLMNAYSRRCLAIIALTVLGTNVALCAGDIVVLKGNRGKTEGRVSSDGMKGVVVTVARGGTGEMTYSPDQVDKVVYEKTPVEYGYGMSSMAAGNFDDAVIHFEGALGEEHAPLLEQYILMNMGTCLYEMRKYDQAVTYFEKLKDMGDDTRYKVEARKYLIDLNLSLGDTRKVKKLLDELDRGNSKSEQVAIMTIRARVEEQGKRYAEALQLYNQAISKAATDPDMAGGAEIGAVRCLVSLKKYDDAVRRITSLVRGSHEPQEFAEAYLLMGDALKAQASTPEEWEAALLAYLRVPALYGGDERTEARALLEASRCYSQMPGESSKKRASNLLGLLQSKYPDSEVTKAEH
jgi:tetratricopeptide (TPR) repeat protein